ncbi:MAG: hypothetical protein JWP97_325 [Labilithrix sp.]|nr:hypothetical protein [Labilithrix sp.]
MNGIFSRFAPLLVVLSTLFAAGCGSVAFQPSIQSVGEYKNTARVADLAEDMPEHSAEKVKVLVQSLPDGMTVKDGLLDYDRSQYELLGKVAATYKDPSLVNLGFWVYGYKESDRWRKALCTWQVPLSWVTLTMWSWLSPTYYPCRVKAGEEEERRADVVETLQRATKALGGDLVVVSGFGGVNFITVDRNSGGVVAANAIGTLNGSGYAFRTLGPGAPKHGKDTPATPVKGVTHL